jgi:hypothetical protein
MAMTRAVIVVTNVALAAALCAGAGCEKSRNPVGPSAGRQTGSAALLPPPPLSPANGAQVVGAEPVWLVMGRAESTSARPFWYAVELSADVTFTSTVYTNDRVTPSGDGPTTLVVDVPLPSGSTYYWRARAEDGVNRSDFSPPARFEVVAPVLLDAPAPRSPGGGATTPSLRPELVVENGRVDGAAGALQYIFVIAADQAFTQVVAHRAMLRAESATTSMRPESDLPPDRLLFWRAYAYNGALVSAPSATEAFRTPSASASGPGPPGSPVPPGAPGGRTPDPAPGGRLPLPNMFAIVQQMAAQHPDALRNSCQHNGGTWEFMDRVVNALRMHDTRWGYNWKRGVVGDPSLDVVAYHWGSGPDEGSTSVYIIDVIVGHCGSDPSAGWGDVTDVTLESGSIGRWTGRGRF